MFIGKINNNTFDYLRFKSILLHSRITGSRVSVFISYAVQALASLLEYKLFCYIILKTLGYLVTSQYARSICLLYFISLLEQGG